MKKLFRKMKEKKEGKDGILQDLDESLSGPGPPIQTSAQSSSKLPSRPVAEATAQSSIVKSNLVANAPATSQPSPPQPAQPVSSALGSKALPKPSESAGSPQAGVTPFRLPVANQTPPAPSNIASVDDFLRNIMEMQSRLSRTQQPPLCGVCYNLDPTRAPEDKRFAGPWVAQEYNVPTGTVSAKVIVDKSEKLREAARNGCIYCKCVSLALKTVEPAWETRETFMTIFLATALPIVVRLESGTMYRASLGKLDEPVGSGFEYLNYVEDTNVEIIASLDGPAMKSFEVEIYRPTLPGYQPSSQDLTTSSLIPNIGHAEEIARSAKDQQCFDFIEKHVKRCTLYHGCGKYPGTGMLPDRVLWIEAKNASRIQLIEPKGTRAKFIALSYCWGPVGPDVFLTDKRTFGMRKAGIEYKDLPPLFQDVVDVARALKIEYIWIDRLCIIQGDDQDFQTQAPKMGEVYGNASLVIASASATTEHDRFLVPRSQSMSATDIDLNFPGQGALTLRARQRSHVLGTEHTGGDYGKMSTRAWIWQERLLAARTIFFTPTALKFECRHHTIWEGYSKAHTSPSWSSKLDKMDFATWASLVEEYTRRVITQPSDRFPAIEGVMKRIEYSKGWYPLWGIWESELEKSLSWQLGYEATRCRPNPDRTIPTWSWASLDAPISYHCVGTVDTILDSRDPIQWDLECINIIQNTGAIRVSAYAAQAGLFAVLEEVKDQDDTKPKQKQFRYEFRKSPSDTQKGYPVHSDGSLKPWTHKVNGKDVTTAIRVSPGERPPEKSWSADCLVLLLGKRKQTCTVLFLGQSPRLQDAGERIGIAEGVALAAFQTASKLTIDIA